MHSCAAGVGSEAGQAAAAAGLRGAGTQLRLLHLMLHVMLDGGCSLGVAVLLVQLQQTEQAAGACRERARCAAAAESAASAAGSAAKGTLQHALSAAAGVGVVATACRCDARSVA